ncbi:MAG: hypothetical protein JSV71_04405 [Nitrospiraceae bacterium]|nr:MAG: hypothetical protein JSV71_04405 [Nitrospiraceae bacterium]
MKNYNLIIFLIALSLAIGGYHPVTETAQAQSDFIIYPNEGQSKEQQEKDQFSCYSWAKGQTGFDPMERPTATAPPPQKEAKKGGVGRGAVGGALLGAGIGAIAGDAGKGAAIGGLSGGAIGGMRRQEQKRQEEQAQQQWAQQQVSQYEHRRNEYNRAYTACLEGRGYTVR